MSYMIRESLCCDDCDHVMVGLRYDADDGPQCDRCEGRKLSPLLRGEAKAARDELHQEEDDRGILRAAAAVGFCDVWMNGKKIPQSEVKAALARIQAKNPGKEYHLEEETDATRLEEVDDIRHEVYVKNRKNGIAPEHFKQAHEVADQMGREAAARALNRNEDPNKAYQEARKKGPSPQAIAKGWYRG